VTVANKKTVSIVIPLKDEEQSIPVLAEEITSVMDSSPYSWECLWVDDGSTDRSLEVLERLHASDARHNFVQLDGNYGQSAALAAGIGHASGDLIATLDADMQNDPRDIPRLIAELEKSGVDMVNGIREKRQDSWLRKASSTVANGFRNMVTGSRVTDVGCSMRVFRRECADGIPLFKGMHRFLPTLIETRGYKFTETPVNHRRRRFGRTKYGINNRLWAGLGDTLMVRWFRSRAVNPAVRRTSLDGETAAQTVLEKEEKEWKSSG
jgi:glycosyltransferase involved in cell wall biosynthesis